MRWSGQLQFRNVKPLGQGGHGKVFAATLECAGGISEPVVLKLPHGANPEELAQSREFLLEEARLVAKLRHPNIIGFRDYNEVEVDGAITPCLVLEDGGVALSDLLRLHGGRLEPGLAAFIAVGILSGLAHAHQHSTVHRDVKPSNVVIGKHGQVQLIDFGIAKSADSQNPTTTVGMLKGTTLYMSPEAYVGKKLDERADLWSVGILLYEMLIGRYPWHISRSECANNFVYAGRVAKAVQDSPLPDLPHELVPASLVEIVQKLTNKSRDARFESATATINALERAMTRLISPVAAARELGQQATAALSQLGLGSRSVRPAQPDAPTFDIRSAAQPEEYVSVVLPHPVTGGVDIPSGLFESDVVRRTEPLGPEEVTEQVDVPRMSRRKGIAAALAAAACVAVIAGARLSRSPSSASASGSPSVDAGRPLHARSEPSASMVAATELQGPREVVVQQPELGARAARPPVAPAPQGLAVPDAPSPVEVSSAAHATAARTETPDTASGAPVPAKTTELTATASARGGVLEVIVVPRGAFVSVDGQSPTQAPAKFDSLQVGSHLVKIGLRANELTERRRVRVRPGQMSKLEVELANPF